MPQREVQGRQTQARRHRRTRREDEHEAAQRQQPDPGEKAVVDGPPPPRQQAALGTAERHHDTAPAAAGTRWSSPTNLLNVSPRCSKSRNWSKDAHAGARRTTGLPVRSAQAAAAWRTALARSPLCVQGRAPPAPGQSPRPPRRSDRRGARDRARAARHRGRPPWAARPRSSRCGRNWRARAAASGLVALLSLTNCTPSTVATVSRR